MIYYPFRLDIFMNGEHVKRYFHSEQSARKAGEEAKRDGAKSVFLLRQMWESLYEIIEQL